MTTIQDKSLRADFRERAKANSVSIAHLIGFKAEAPRLSSSRHYGYGDRSSHATMAVLAVADLWMVAGISVTSVLRSTLENSEKMFPIVETSCGQRQPLTLPTGRQQIS